MEGRVLACSWKRDGDWYCTWWKARPKVCGEGATFEAADEALYEAIMVATGDGENQRDYDPPAPGSGRLPLLDVYYVEAGRDTARITNGDALFSDGLCPDCRRGRGVRTDEPIDLETRESGAILVTVLPEHWVGPRISLYSERFVAALSDAERDACTWRNVSGPPRSRMNYLELENARSIVPLMMPAGFPHTGWRCEVCGYVTGPLYTGGSDRDPCHFISHADLPPLEPVMIAVGRRPELSLCVSRERWTELRKEKGLTKLRGAPLGVLADQHVDRYAAPAATWREANTDVLAKRARHSAADTQSG